MRMMRVAVLSLFVLQTLFGPATCCCRFGQFLRLFETAATQVCEAEDQMPTCCHARSTHEKGSKPERDLPTAPCPCKNQQGDSNTKQPSLPRVDSDSPARIAIIQPIGSFPQAAPYLLSIAFVDTAETAQSHPFVSAEELLHTLHILRC